MYLCERSVPLCDLERVECIHVDDVPLNFTCVPGIETAYNSGEDPRRGS